VLSHRANPRARRLRGTPPGSARFPPAAIDTLEAGLHIIRDTARAILICLVMTFAFLYMALGFSGHSVENLCFE
jgi:hypothetical protein